MSTNTFTAKARVAFAVTGLGLMAALTGCSGAAIAETAQTSAASDSTTTTEATTDATTEATTDATTEATTASDYTDGTYTTTATYQSPGGTESLGVSITVSDDLVTAVTVTNEAESANGKQYQTRFIAATSDVVVGKDLSTLSVSKVAGASLTSNGFDDALDEIRSQAAA